MQAAFALSSARRRVFVPDVPFPRPPQMRLLAGLACAVALAAAQVVPAAESNRSAPLGRQPKLALANAPMPTVRVLVVLVHWQGGDAAYLRNTVQDPMWRDVAAFWSRETYGRQTLDITVTPLLDSTKPMPGCAHAAVSSEAVALARAAGFTGAYDRYVFVSTPGCGIQWATLGTLMYGYSYVSYAGKAAHEMGHSFGLQHSRSSVAAENLYGVYGNAWEVMSGIWPDTATWHFNGYDKWRLGVLSPQPCADATLRPIEDYPDALRCGTLWAELHQDGNVWVFKEETTPSDTYGLSDNTRMAILKPGESFGGIANAGGGRVSAHAP